MMLTSYYHRARVPIHSRSLRKVGNHGLRILRLSPLPSFQRPKTNQTVQQARCARWTAEAAIPTCASVLLTFLPHPSLTTVSKDTLHMPTLRTLPVLTLTLCLFTAPLFAAPPMSDTDREHLLVHYQMTTQMINDQVRGLSPAQLEYKASPDR